MFVHNHLIWVPYFITNLPQCPKVEPIQVKVESEEQETHEEHQGHRKGKGHSWSTEETNKLINNYKKYNGNWKAIVKHLKGRNMSQCSQKYRKLTGQEQRTKSKWTAEEDKLLLDAYEVHGRQWMKLAECLPNRTCKQARDRYINKLDPSINQAPWSQEEEETVVRMYKEVGPKWTLISKSLQNRSENQVKNKFYYCIQKKYSGVSHPYLKVSQ